MKLMMSRIAVALSLVATLTIVGVAEAQDVSVDADATASAGVISPKLPVRPLPFPGPRVPEIDPSLSRAIVILLLSGVLILTDRRQRSY